MNPSTANPLKLEMQQVSKQLIIDWQDGSKSEISFERLRECCACSACRAKRVKDIEINGAGIDVLKINPMGSSGIQLEFSDGHDQGIFPWGYLKAIGEGQEKYFLETQRRVAC